MLAYLKSGRQKECGWLCKEKAITLRKTTNIHLDPNKSSLIIKIHNCIQQLTTGLSNLQQEGRQRAHKTWWGDVLQCEEVLCDLYDDEEDWEGEHDENENGNI